MARGAGCHAGIPAFTAAYFDHSGLYAFGRQAEALYWNCGQLAVALRQLAEAPPLVAALERFGPLYQAALAERFLWRLGLEFNGFEADSALIAEAERHMREGQLSPDAFFHRHRQCCNPPADAFGAALRGHAPVPGDHPLWNEAEPPTLVIDEVERILVSHRRAGRLAAAGRQAGADRAAGRGTG